MAKNGEFAKRHTEYRGVEPTNIVRKDLTGARLRDSEKTEVKLSKGKVVLRKTALTLCAVGSIAGLAATGFGAVNIAAIAIRPEFNLISFETLSWALTTGIGYKLSKVCVPTSMRNSETLRPYYDAIVDVKESISNPKTKTK